MGILNDIFVHMYGCVLRWKNFDSPSAFGKVTGHTILAFFFLTHCGFLVPSCIMLAHYLSWFSSVVRCACQAKYKHLWWRGHREVLKVDNCWWQLFLLLLLDACEHSFLLIVCHLFHWLTRLYTIEDKTF